MRKFNPASRKSNLPIDEDLFLRAARAYALQRFPNPDRKGCPTAEEIGAMARHQISLSVTNRARIEHIATCSPCLSEYQAARGRWKRRRYTVAILAAATAAAVAIVIASVTWVRLPPPPSSPTSPPVVDLGRSHAQPQVATLDLRRFDVSRGEPKGSVSVPILTRANLRLTVFLPVGSDEGSYNFEVRDERSSALIQGTGIAVIRNYITRIETTVDLSSLSPGQFIWAIRRAGESSWHLYPLKVN